MTTTVQDVLLVLGTIIPFVNALLIVGVLIGLVRIFRHVRR